MNHALRRLIDDLSMSWDSMPKKQALHWYCMILLNIYPILKSKKLYFADLKMRGFKKFYFNDQSFSFDLSLINSTPGSGYTLLRELFVRRIYFRAFKHIIFGTCLDLGCNIGIVSSILSDLSGPEGRVIAIDAQEYSDNLFRKHVEKIPRIEFGKHVICGNAVRNDPIKLSRMCALYHFDPKLAATVTDIMTNYQLTHVNFLKMDIEGAEFEIFSDTADWLRQVDNLAMEVHPSSGDPRIILEKLKVMGFRVSWCDEFGYSSKPENAGFIYASSVGALRQREKDRTP